MVRKWTPLILFCASIQIFRRKLSIHIHTHTQSWPQCILNWNCRHNEVWNRRRRDNKDEQDNQRWNIPRHRLQNEKKNRSLTESLLSRGKRMQIISQFNARFWYLSFSSLFSNSLLLTLARCWFGVVLWFYHVSGSHLNEIRYFGAEKNVNTAGYLQKPT